MADAVCLIQEGCACVNVYVAVEVGSELVRQSVTCEKCRVIGQASSCNFVANEFAACFFRSPRERHDPQSTRLSGYGCPHRIDAVLGGALVVWYAHRRAESIVHSSNHASARSKAPGTADAHVDRREGTPLRFEPKARMTR